MKQILNIAGINYEVYNQTEGVKHMIKLGKNGNRLSPNATNLLTMTETQINKYTLIGTIYAVS